jgi:integrase
VELCPCLGDMPLSSIGNPPAKGLVGQMLAERRSHKTIKNVIRVAKMVVAFAINDEGDQIYLRNWNHEFIDLPDVSDQHTPTYSADEVQRIVPSAKGQSQMLYALLAGTGMRIGEVSGLEIDKPISHDASTIKTLQSVRSGAVQTPTARNGMTEIDITSELALAVREFIGERKSGL